MRCQPKLHKLCDYATHHNFQGGNCHNHHKPKMHRMPKNRDNYKKMTISEFNRSHNEGINDEKVAPKVLNVVGMSQDEEFEFKVRADTIRTACVAEIASAKTSHDTGNEATRTTTLAHDKPLNAIPNINNNAHNERREAGSHAWKMMSMAVDSGAAETVIPHALITDYPILETEASRSGLNYVSASGDPIPNLGEQRLPLVTAEGTIRAMTLQAAPVSRPLGSVMRMCRSGHRVIFDDEGSYIEHKVSGEINWLREEDGNYMLDVWVIPRETIERGKQGFARQP